MTLKDISKSIQDLFNQGSHAVGNAFSAVNSNPIGHQIINSASQAIQSNPIIRVGVQNPQVQNIAFQNLQHGVQAVGQAIPSFIKGFTPGLQQQTTMKDIGNVSRGAGYLFAPEATALGGAFTGGIQAVQNLVNRKPITNNLAPAMQQGNDFAATLSPIGKVASSLPVVSKIAPALSGANPIRNFGAKAVQGGVEQFLTGAGYGLSQGQNPLQAAETGLSFVPYGVTHGLGEKPSLKSNMKGVNPNAFKMHPEDLDTGKAVLDILRYNKKDGVKVIPEQRQQALKSLQNLLDAYIPGHKFSGTKKALDALEYVIQTNEQVPKDIRTPFPGVGLVDSSGNFTTPYQKGDIKTLQGNLAKVTGDKSARSVQQIPHYDEIKYYADQGDPGAIKQLQAIDKAQVELQKAQEAKNLPKITQLEQKLAYRNQKIIENKTNNSVTPTDFVKSLGANQENASTSVPQFSKDNKVLQDSNSLDNSVPQPTVKMSHTGNIYIKDGENIIKNLPKTVQNDIYSIVRKDGIPSPERLLKTNTYLNRLGLELNYDGSFNRTFPGYFTNSIENQIKRLNNPESFPTTIQGQNTVPSVGEILQTKQPSGGQKTPLSQTTNQISSSDNSIPLPVNPPQRVNAFRQFFDRARNVIASQGTAGKQLAQDIQTARDNAEITAGKWVAQLPTVRSLSKGEFVNMVDVAEGNAKPLSQKVAQAAQEWDNVRNQVFNTAQTTGLDIGKVENYFPHTYDNSIFTNKNKYNEALNHLVETGQAKNQADAIRLLSYAQDIVRNRKQGNLEFERLVNLPNFEKTKDALFGYLESAANRISQVNTFGQQDENALKLIEQVAREGGDAQTVKSLFDISTGARKYGALQSKISGTVRGFNSVTKLGTGAITNAGQSINTATVVGGLRTLINAPKAAFSREAKDFALQAGITLDGVIKDLKEGGGFSGKLGSLGAPGFNTVEKFNRTLAAIAGRDYARSLAQKGDVKTLAKMGVKLVGRKLTPEQEVQAARNIVERTQFKVDPQDLPGWASSPWGKVVAQFRQFSYNQSAFMGREVIAPALKGDIRPLVRFLAIGIPVGVGIQTTKNILRNRKDEENPVKRVQQGFSQVGGMGLAGDVVTGLFPMNGRYLDPNRATTLAISTLGGPTFGTLAEGYGALTNAIQGKPENLGRFSLRQVPVIGSTLQNTILPYKAADGSVNQRFGVNQAGAAETTPVKTTGIDYLSKDQVDAQIKKLDAQEKAIKGKNGVFGIGGLTDSQKNNQIGQIESQKENIKVNQKIAELGQTKGTGIKAFTSENDKYSLGRQIWDNNKLSQEQKTQAFKKMGLDPQDVRYDSLAHNNTDVSIQYIKSKSPDHNTLLQNLYTGRQVSISGTQFASDAVITALNKEGLLSDSEAKVLKNLKLDKKGNNITKSETNGKKTIKVNIKAPTKGKNITIRKSTAKAPKISLPKAPTITVKKAKKPSLRFTNTNTTVPKYTVRGFKNTLTG